MAIRYGKLRIHCEDYSSSTNLLQSETNRSSTSVWVPMNSISSDKIETNERYAPRNSNSQNETRNLITRSQHEGYYSYPKLHALATSEQNCSRNDHRNSHHLSYDCYGSSTDTTDYVSGNPDTSNGLSGNQRQVKHRIYANFPKHNLAVPDIKTRAKSYDRPEYERVSRSDSKKLRRTLSRTRYDHDTNKTPDIWSATANRVGRLNTRLLNAIECHNNVEVESMLLAGANPNATCRAGHISACHAAAYSNVDALHLLLKLSVEKDRKDKFGRTPLHLAAWAGRNWTIAMLLDFPVDLQYKVVMRVTPEAEEEIKQLRPSLAHLINVPCELPIISCLQQNWKDSIEHKCRRYMTLLPKFFSGWTPLHIASYAGHHEAIRLLLAAGANPNSKDAMGQTPLDICGAACYLDSGSATSRVDSFVKTIKTLIEFGGKLNVSDTTLSSSVLHTAVEMDSVEAIRELLAAGAPVSHQNAKGNTPLHECVDKLYQESLQVLANHGRRGQNYRSVDVMNSSGYTVLHAAIMASWVPGVCIALDAGASVTLEAHDGRTAIHIAALEGNIDILDEILLNAAQYEDSVNYDNGRTEPPLFCAIRSGNTECVQAILDAGAKMKMTYYVEPNFKDTTMEPYLMSISPAELNDFNMLIHATAEVGNVEMLELLFENNKQLEHLLHYNCPYLMKMIPVEFAAHHNRFETFKFLLKKTLEYDEQKFQVKNFQGQTHLSFKRFYHSRLLHIIAVDNREDLFEELIRQIPNAVHTANGRGYYPLHDAARNGNRNLIAQLIHYGADLSEEDECGVTAINLVVDNLCKSNEFLATILDKYIYTSRTKNKSDCEITVDYRVLIPKTVEKLENKGQMRVLRALLKTKNRNNQRKLLAHPLVESFLYLKWKTLCTYFYLMVFLYCLFVFSLSAFTVSVFFYKDKNYNETVINQTSHVVLKKIWTPDVWQYIIYITLGMVVIQELSCTNLAPRTWTRRVLSIEFWVKFVAYCFTIVTSQVIPHEYQILPGQIDWRRHMATVALVMGWLNIMMLLSKTPMAGYYMQMFWVVSSKIIKILITFSFLILMFSFCFMIQFHSKEPFEGPWAAVVKTIVMMTSEFDYDDTFNKKKTEDLTTSVQLLRLAFVIFLVLTALVLMNLTIGVAVHDVQKLLQDGNLKRLDKQVGFLNRLEVSRGKKSFFHLFGLHRWFNCKKVPSTVSIKPVNDEKCLYSRSIKEAITNKAQEQLDKIGKEAELHKVVLKLENISQTVQDAEKNIVEYINDLNLNFQQGRSIPLIEHEKHHCFFNDNNCSEA